MTATQTRPESQTGSTGEQPRKRDAGSAAYDRESTNASLKILAENDTRPKGIGSEPETGKAGLNAERKQEAGNGGVKSGEAETGKVERKTPTEGEEKPNLSAGQDTGNPLLNEFNKTSSDQVRAALQAAGKVSHEVLQQFGNLDLIGANPEIAESQSGSLIQKASALAGSADWGAQHFENYLHPANNRISNALEPYSHGGDMIDEKSGGKSKIGSEGGTIDVAGSKLTVSRTPDGGTVLKRGDQVVAQRKSDGSYSMNLNDDSRADFALSRGEDGQYKLDHMERYKGDKLVQKYKDGVDYKYNYNADGDQSKVDAAADLKGPMTHEQIQARLDAIRQELGNDGAAAIRLNQDGQEKRLLMQTHGGDHSITDIDKHQASLFHNGQEFRLGDNNQLGVVDKDGKWTALDPSNSGIDSQVQQNMTNLLNQLNQRAFGDTGATVGGVGLSTGTDGSAVISRLADNGTDLQSQTTMPGNTDGPIVQQDCRSGERTSLSGNDFTVSNQSGDPIMDFNSASGLSGGDFVANSDGLFDTSSGIGLGSDGGLYDLGSSDYPSSAASFISDRYLNTRYDRQQTVADQTISSAAAIQVSTLGGEAMSMASGDDPGSTKQAFALAGRAVGVADAALARLGNDTAAQFNVAFAKGTAEDARDEARGHVRDRKDDASLLATA